MHISSGTIRTVYFNVLRELCTAFALQQPLRHTRRVKALVASKIRVSAPFLVCIKRLHKHSGSQTHNNCA
jgi:hypothetical protein